MPAELPAILFLMVLGLLVALWIIVAISRNPYTIPQSILYFLCVLLTRILWRASIPTQLPIAHGQGAVLISNHRSSVDPFFYQVAAHRVVHWMVMRSAVESGAYGWFLRQTECIPVGRGGIDTAATKMAIRLAAQGNVVGMFPEGRINTTSDFMMKVRPGAILVALKAGVPVLPCYVEGSPYRGTVWSPLVTPAKVKLIFGRPMDLSAYYGREREPGVLQQLVCNCVREIARLAGRDDFEPQLAGRNWLPNDEELDAAAAHSRRESASGAALPSASD